MFEKDRRRAQTVPTPFERSIKDKFGQGFLDNLLHSTHNEVKRPSTFSYSDYNW